jgi:hypothetical protein
MISRIAPALAATLVGCAGVGGATREPPLMVVATDQEPELAPPGLGLHPGESMTFSITLNGVEAGEAAFAVGEPGVVDDRDALVVSSRMSSTGVFRAIKVVDDELTSTIDAATGLPYKFAADVVFGSRTYHADGVFHGGQVDLEWHRGDGKLRHSHHDFGDITAHDAHTAMAAMRIWDGEPGAQRRLFIVGGRRLWRTDVTWVGRETIGTELGNQNAIRLDGISVRVDHKRRVHRTAKARTFTVWMSDDADRVPLRVTAMTELGEVEIVLTGYR